MEARFHKIARLDIIAENFWGRDRQCAFFDDVRVFNPFAQSHRNTPLAQCYRRNEMEKRRQYDERVREIEHGSFSPLVFTTSGGMGTNRIVSMIAERNYALDQMQIELLPPKIGNRVPSRIPLCSPSPCRYAHYHSYHGP